MEYPTPPRTQQEIQSAPGLTRLRSPIKLNRTGQRKM
jgi:hypothetical protein